MVLNLESIDIPRTLPVLLAVGALACADLIRRWKHKQSHLLFACVLGTFLSIALIRGVQVGIGNGQGSPFVVAAVVACVVVAWRCLFGPWEPHTKAAVLGVFLFWIAAHMLWAESGRDQLVRMLAVSVAFVPAVVWIVLFLKYHAERLSAVVLLFFAGMLATAPILFYDYLVRRGVELNFFLFTLTPESFGAAVQRFVGEHIDIGGGLATPLLVSFLTFVLVAVIEEASKYWVLTRSAKQLFRSVDDVLQLSIVVAIGFAFAENIVNPVYFTAFIRDYLLKGSDVNLVDFAGNVLGRSVLTTMVHVLSTGIMGYFFALAWFAGPYLRERHAAGHAYRLTRWIHALARVPEESVFRVNMLVIGYVIAVVLHAVFNFIVTIPELLPGNPTSIGQLFSSLPDIFDRVPLLMAPSLLYVVGGFWFLTSLFLRKENMVELGHLRSPDGMAD